MIEQLSQQARDAALRMRHNHQEVRIVDRQLAEHRSEGA